MLQAQTLEELADGLQDACARLEALDLFSEVDVLADASEQARRRSRQSPGRLLTLRRRGRPGRRRWW